MHMKIELKRIQFIERLSEETNCFVADLHINGKKIGLASNRGDGEVTVYEPNKKDDRLIMNQAASYCEGLPPEKGVFDGEHLEFKMDLSTFIDGLVNRFMAAKALRAFSRKLQIRTGKKIMYGEPDPGFLVLRFNRPFVDVINFNIWKEELVENIHNTVKPVRLGGKVYYVTDMPADICKEAGLSPLKNMLKPVQSISSRKQKLKSKQGKKL